MVVWILINERNFKIGCKKKKKICVKDSFYDGELNILGIIYCNFKIVLGINIVIVNIVIVVIVLIILVNYKYILIN